MKALEAFLRATGLWDPLERHVAWGARHPVLFGVLWVLLVLLPIAVDGLWRVIR